MASRTQLCAVQGKKRHVALEDTIVKVQNEVEEARKMCRMHIQPKKDWLVSAHYLLRQSKNTNRAVESRGEGGRKRRAVKEGGTGIRVRLVSKSVEEGAARVWRCRLGSCESGREYRRTK